MPWVSEGLTSWHGQARDRYAREYIDNAEHLFNKQHTIASLAHYLEFSVNSHIAKPDGSAYRSGPNIVPSWEDIETLPQPLRTSERTLVDALLQLLDQTWTIYVQPHVNGLRPDVVIFSPRHGIAVFEVKEWSLGSYKIEIKERPLESAPKRNAVPDYEWLSLGGPEGRRVACPFQQVERYRDAIIRFEIPVMNGEVESNPKFFSVVSTFIYFHGHSRKYLEDVLNVDAIEGEYRRAIGEDELEPDQLLKILSGRLLMGNRQSSNFESLLRKYAPIIQTSFYPPKFGETDLKYINSPLNAQQELLLPNTPDNKRKHVIGGAGTGKSFVLVRKAVNAARDKKRVLIVMFNITMANLIRDLVLRLCSYYGPHVHRYIEVCHYHRLMFGPVSEEGMAVWEEAEEEQDLDDPHASDTESRVSEQAKVTTYRGGKYEVLLIDEGQDFLSRWYDNLREMTVDDAHIMFFEDDRQNIYARQRSPINDKGHKPYFLRATYRIPPNLSQLANELIRFQKIDNQSGDIEPLKKKKADPMLSTFGVRWLNAIDVADASQALFSDLRALWQLGRLGQPADTVILLCQVEHGYGIDEWLSRNLAIPRNRMFETRAEANKIKKRYGVFHEPTTLAERIEFEEKWEDYKDAVSAFRRQFKVAYRMRSDGIKLSTIHSFKGWELEQVFIVFAPDSAKQMDADVQLLYTALTRSQNLLWIYNTDENLARFGEHAIEINLAERWHPIEY